MALGGIVELLFGVKAEQVPLEDIAKPLTAEEAEHTPDREREGRRRYRPGPGLEYPYYSPGLMGTSLRRPTALVELQHEVEAIGRAVDEGGPDLPGRAVPHGPSATLGAGPLPAGARRGRCGGPDPAHRTGPVRSPEPGT